MVVSKGAPGLSAVVTTIGRPAELRRLVASLTRLRNPEELELVVVDQSDDQSCLALLKTLETPFEIRTAVSPRGASLGRNVGARLASGTILTFPNDYGTYEPSTVADILDRMTREPGLGALSGIQRTPDGRPSQLRWPATGQPVTRKNVWLTVIEPTLAIRRSLFESLGGFDETIGTGSPGPYQSGEVTDLVLRALDAGERIIYDPSIEFVMDDPRDRVTAGFEAKMLGYGRGIGHLYRVHHLSRAQLGYYVARKYAAAGVRTIRGRRDLAKADLAWAKGARQGYRSMVSQ